MAGGDLLTERINGWFQDLVQDGIEIVAMAQNSADALAGEDVARVAQWVNSVEQLLRSLHADGGPYLRTISETIARENSSSHDDGFYSIHSLNHVPVSVVLGALKSAHTDFKTGRLRRIRDLVRAEVFADFFDMAERLLEAGYKDPAAMLGGAVLEMSLRKLAQRAGISLVYESGKRKTMAPLNDELAKAEQYSALVHRQIAVFAELRNQADHGHFDSYDVPQVKQMIDFGRDFGAKHVSI